MANIDAEVDAKSYKDAFGPRSDCANNTIVSFDYFTIIKFYSAHPHLAPLKPTFKVSGSAD
jgi:hypothetical protein